MDALLEQENREEAETQHVYFFGDGDAEGGTDLVDLLGGKGSNLAEMSRIGIPVPPGFTISTEVCRRYYALDHEFPEGLKDTLQDHLERVEDLMGQRFGDPEDPLLLSVRSGAPVSMPGMMDTILNLGLNDETVQGLARQSDDERFAWDSYRRFVQMYGNVVVGIDGDRFEGLIEGRKDEAGVREDTDLSADDWRALVDRFKQVYEEETGERFPEDPVDQLWGSIRAVLESWNNERAVKWREINDLPHDVGTAVNVQAMVFGNLGETSATGVGFTRDAATGDREYNGEFLPNAQGEDVVAGTRTPLPLNDYERQSSDKGDLPTLEEMMPEAYRELEEVFERLEKHYGDMQDVEFTVQQGDLYLLQTRTGKRTAEAMVKIAHDMAEEGLISRKKALDRVDAGRLSQVLHPRIKSEVLNGRSPLASGLGASPGGASGRIVLTAEEAEKRSEHEDVLLVRHETSPDDIGGMNAAEGILTSRGGRTSHAAVVARGMGKPCVAGCGALEIDYESERITLNGDTFRPGDWLTLDGSTGDVYQGELEMEEAGLTEEFEELMEWADEFRHLDVRTNADTGEDARLARSFGAEGIGLCRTEHMFFEESRIDRVRAMILRAPEVHQLRMQQEHLEEELQTAPEEQQKTLREDLEAVQERLAEVEGPYRETIRELLPEQRKDLEEVFRVMDGRPVTVRLLDPPLHEFLPEGDEEKRRVADRLDVPFEEIERLVEQLTETNPMLGHRGCRLGLSFPEVYEMQTRAVLEAARNARRDGIEVEPEIMIPLVGLPRELEILRERVEDVARAVIEQTDAELDCRIGTMIELPRAALLADQIADHAEFFSFGTNDMTQTTFGISRDDSRMFLDYYRDLDILEDDPFEVLDEGGVGELIEVGVERGRDTRPDLSVGICGEHGGDPDSVVFCHEAGLDYVSCSPYRVPTARISAAQAAIDVEEDVSSY